MKESPATNDELRRALEYCAASFNAGGRAHGWRRRVEHLQSLMDSRKLWPTIEDQELAMKIRRYLRAAGAAV